MTHNEHLSEQVSELRWLVYERGREMQALSTTPYPQVHHFLIRTLARKIAQVAEITCTCTALGEREEITHGTQSA